METRPPLTRRQSAVLDLIHTSVQERGYPPSVREIGEAVGLSSTSSVAHVVRALEGKGYIEVAPNAARAMTVLDDAEPGPDQRLRWACRELINASLDVATRVGDDASALIRQAKAWDQVALTLDAAEDAAR